MRFEFTVSVEVERESGKFASRDDIGQAILEEIDNANPGSIDGVGADGDSVYQIDNWSVEEVK